MLKHKKNVGEYFNNLDHFSYSVNAIFKLTLKFVQFILTKDLLLLV